MSGTDGGKPENIDQLEKLIITSLKTDSVDNNGIHKSRKSRL